MYVRFVSPLIDVLSRVETAIFQSKRHLYRQGCPDWIVDAIQEEWGWFGEHLDIPKRFATRFGRRGGTLWGICWFRPQAQEAIRRARYCAWLMEEGGLPIRCITTLRPGHVIWQDDEQIVAKPTVDLPRGFH